MPRRGGRHSEQQPQNFGWQNTRQSHESQNYSSNREEEVGAQDRWAQLTPRQQSRGGQQPRPAGRITQQGQAKPQQRRIWRSSEEAPPPGALHHYMPQEASPSLRDQPTRYTPLTPQPHAPQPTRYSAPQTYPAQEQPLAPARYAVPSTHPVQQPFIPLQPTSFQEPSQHTVPVSFAVLQPYPTQPMQPVLQQAPLQPVPQQGASQARQDQVFMMQQHLLQQQQLLLGQQTPPQLSSLTQLQIAQLLQQELQRRQERLRQGEPAPSRSFTAQKAPDRSRSEAETTRTSSSSTALPQELQRSLDSARSPASASSSRSASQQHDAEATPSAASRAQGTSFFPTQEEEDEEENFTPPRPESWLDHAPLNLHHKPCSCEAKLPIHQHEVLDSWEGLLDESTDDAGQLDEAGDWSPGSETPAADTGGTEARRNSDGGRGGGSGDSCARCGGFRGSRDAWYNVAFLLQHRVPVAKEQAVSRLRVEARPLPPVGLPRGPSEDLMAPVRCAANDGLSLFLSALAGSTGGYGTPCVEQLAWQLLQLAEPPNWIKDSRGSNGGARLLWRTHCVDLKARPSDFRSGPRNRCCLGGETGAWVRESLHPGIMELQLTVGRGMPLHLRVGRKGGTSKSAKDYEVRQLILADNVHFCLEHRRPEEGLKCLCPEAVAEVQDGLIPASEVMRWDSSADYVAAWRPAVELEAAATAAEEGDGRLLFNVEILWSADGRGSFELSTGLASAHRMKLRSLIGSEDGLAEWASGWLCIRCPGRRTNGAGEWSCHAGIVEAALVGDGHEEPLQASVGEEEEWLQRASRDQQGDSVRITFKMIQGASDPCPTPGLRRQGYVVEFLPKSLPYSCMAVALSELATASPLLREAVLNARAPMQTPQATPSPQDEDPQASWQADLPSQPASRAAAMASDIAPWQLNPPQENAVRGAMEDALCLIHGPPGTGKTTTAAALVVIYAIQNLCDGAVASVLYCTPSNDAADVACRRVAQSADKHFRRVAELREQEVLAAGNQAAEQRGERDCPICLTADCDAITACGHQFHKKCLAKAMAAGSRGCPLCRRPLRQSSGGLTALRVYSAEMERAEFPVPKRIDHPSAKPRRPRAVPMEMRPYALHWRCHGVAPDVEPTPEAKVAGKVYAELYEAGPNHPSFDELRYQYWAALAEARAAELRRADAIFATCISARRGGLAAALRADGAPELRQVVVDEAGQAPEPEALCPLTLARQARKIVLVGDPKQLRPIIKSPAAQRLGLDVSLLERLSEAPSARPRLLSLQYRMHPLLNAFPSAFFYGGKVRDDPSVLQRADGLFAHPERPHKPCPLLLWTSEPSSNEQILQVRTSESSARSRFNQAEVTQAVNLARLLAQRVGGSKVAVLSWYNAQVARISEMLRDTGVHVGGVVSAQGNEWDYVILSTVRCAPGGLGALADEHLLDVALTRARLGLCVLATPAVLRRNHAWASFIDHCESQKACTVSAPALRQMLRT